MPNLCIFNEAKESTDSFTFFSFISIDRTREVSLYRHKRRESNLGCLFFFPPPLKWSIFRKIILKANLRMFVISKKKKNTPDVNHDTQTKSVSYWLIPLHICPVPFLGTVGRTDVV